jgi:ATP-dependent exoDNAse (exonuclease V) beta subunit
VDLLESEGAAAAVADRGTPVPAGPDRKSPASPAERSIRRLSVTQWLEADAEEPESTGSGSPDGSLVGTLVHRLFQAFTRGRTVDADPGAMVRGLIRAEERAVTANLTAVVDSVLEIWDRLRRRDDIAALMASARVFVEVPFSIRVELRDEPVVLRGSIDCLAIAPDGAVSVVEFKTGGRRLGHERQLELYVRAARALFPGQRVEGRLIYA